MIDSFLVKGPRATVCLSGDITIADFEKAIAHLAQSPSLSEIDEFFWIYSDVTDCTVTTDELKIVITFSHQFSDIHPELKVITVTDSPLMYGVSRMFDAYADQAPWQTSSFATMDEAESWLQNLENE